MAGSSLDGTPAAGVRTAAELLVESNGENSVVRLEAASYRVGRAPWNQLSFPGVEGLSREHLAIEYVGGHWVARDLGSTNGSLVNAERISEPRILHSGDRITAGRVSLVYRETDEPAAIDVVLTDEESTTVNVTTIAESMQGLIGEGSQQSSRHMQAIITAGRELATHLPLDKLFDLILDLSMEAAGAARGLLMAFENGELQVRSTKGHGLRISSHVRDLVILEKRSLLVRDAMTGLSARRPRKHRVESDPQYDGRAASNRGPRYRVDLSGFLAPRQGVHQTGSESAHGHGQYGGGPHRKCALG